MRQARIRGQGLSYYHVISRVVDRRFILGDEEREHFVVLMRKLEAFLGLRVVTYVVMSNHFHLLIEEPNFWGQVNYLKFALKILGDTKFLGTG
jgi:putative transposase